jgi:hypothetical protein
MSDEARIEPETYALSKQVGIAHGFQNQDFDGYDLQGQADMMAGAISVYHRISNAKGPDRGRRHRPRSCSTRSSGADEDE